MRASFASPPPRDVALRACFVDAVTAQPFPRRNRPKRRSRKLSTTQDRPLTQLLIRASAPPFPPAAPGVRETMVNSDHSSLVSGRAPVSPKRVSSGHDGDAPPF